MRDEEYHPPALAIAVLYPMFMVTSEYLQTLIFIVQCIERAVLCPNKQHGYLTVQGLIMNEISFLNDRSFGKRSRMHSMCHDDGY